MTDDETADDGIAYKIDHKSMRGMDRLMAFVTAKPSDTPSAIDQICEKFAKNFTDSLTPEEILEKHGYKMIRKLGEGLTRDVYEVEYRNGDYVDRRVAKVPKEIINDASVTTVINQSKGDLNKKEAVTNPKFAHPNIIKIYDAFYYRDGTVTIEEHVNAIDLEELVRLSGPLSDEKFKLIFSQVLKGLHYLHETEGLVHRDIKPENILVAKDDLSVKIADFQNAGTLFSNEKVLMTRGGTAYTDPYLLNRLMESRPSNYGTAQEFYALGATMYFALTGEKLNDISLTKGENGKKIEVDGKTLDVVLMQDGKCVKEIDIEEYDKALKKKLSKVPRQYRQMLYGLLSTKNRRCSGVDTYMDHARLNEDFTEAVRERSIIDWKKVRAYGGAGFVAFGALCGLLAGAKWMEVQERSAPKVLTVDTLREPRFRAISLTGAKFDDGSLDYIIKNQDANKQLAPYFENLKLNLAGLKEKHKEVFSGKNLIDAASDIERIDRKLSYSIIISALMHMNDEPFSLRMNRLNHSYAPVEFVYRINPGSLGHIDMFDKFSQIGYGAKYLKACIGVEKSIADIFAKYFTGSLDEIHTARVAAGTTDFFDKEMVIDGKTFVLKGYGNYLKKPQKDMIHTALAVYYLTDGKGKTHLETLDSSNRPIIGLVAK